MGNIRPWEWRGNQLYDPERGQTLLRDVTFWNLTPQDKQMIASAPDALNAAKMARWALEAMVQLHGPDPAGMSAHALNVLDTAIAAAERGDSSRAPEKP